MLPDEPPSPTGLFISDLALLQQDYLRITLGQVIGRGATSNTASNDDHVRLSFSQEKSSPGVIWTRLNHSHPLPKACSALKSYLEIGIYILIGRVSNGLPVKKSRIQYHSQGPFSRHRRPSLDR